MRVIARNTLIDYWKRYQDAEQSLKAWFDEVRQANWQHPQDLKRQFRNASILSGKRVVFNIRGNTYRLIADIEYRIGIVFIVWFGTHDEYNFINAKEVNYDKSN
jgi:mRNA interferase HigB